MRLQQMAAVAQARVVWQSDWYAFPPVVAKRHDRQPALELLAHALQTMHQTPAGLELLRALNLTGFAQADPAIFAPIKTLAASVGALLQT